MNTAALAAPLAVLAVLAPGFAAGYLVIGPAFLHPRPVPAASPSPVPSLERPVTRPAVSPSSPRLRPASLIPAPAVPVPAPSRPPVTVAPSRTPSRLPSQRPSPAWTHSRSASPSPTPDPTVSTPASPLPSVSGWPVTGSSS